MADRRALIIIEQAEGRKLCDEALREIELGHTSFAKELARFKDAKASCKKKGDDKLCKHWMIAERLLKRAQSHAQIGAKAPTEQESVSESDEQIKSGSA